VTGAVTPGAEYQLTSGRVKGPMNPKLAAPTIVRRKGCSTRTGLPLFAWVGLDRQRPEFINTYQSCARWRGYVSPDYAPLFSTNSWSCLFWNQLCWRFHSRPSSESHVQMVESERWTPWRSSKAPCRRSSVQSWYGYPRVRGLCVARLISLERVCWLCSRGWPGRGSSPAMPRSLKRLTHRWPGAESLYPDPALAADSLGSTSLDDSSTLRQANRCGA
jgi:hypothetical protein